MRGCDCLDPPSQSASKTRPQRAAVPHSPSWNRVNRYCQQRAPSNHMKAVVLLAFALEGVHSWAPSATHLRASPRTRCAAVNLAAHMDVLLSELDTVSIHTLTQAWHVARDRRP